MSVHYADVLIVGGGPAGAACAWRLRQRGVDCLILDKQEFPRAKPCAGWITPQVVRDLQFDPGDYPGAFATFTSLQISVRGLSLRFPTRQHAIRRWEFDHWLLRRAGVPVHLHKVEAIDRVDRAYVVDGAYSAKYLVGAGGARCPVYRSLFQDSGQRTSESLIVTLEEEFPYPYTDAHCRLWFMENGLPGYAWYVPKPGGIVNAGLGGKVGALQARGDRLKRHWALLEEKLDRLGLVQGHAFRPRGYAYHLRQEQPEVRRDNALIVGDSVGLATLDMGEGIGPAIRSGLLAAEAILRDSDYSLRTIPRVSLMPSLGSPLGAYRPFATLSGRRSDRV
jgi:flavin-dependent dehydrogenase